jgi:hypothetical protein
LLNLKNSFLDLLSKMFSLEPGPELHPLLIPQLPRLPTKRKRTTALRV